MLGCCLCLPCLPCLSHLSCVFGLLFGLSLPVVASLLLLPVSAVSIPGSLLAPGFAFGSCPGVTTCRLVAQQRKQAWLVVLSLDAYARYFCCDHLPRP
ncbi:hypothetical protein EJ06DRAFT_526781 [Trichodelitschia bisporula]|uniref:Uncharacterized protein n=1 Tax=Trichodelitschia bisporula TaxID=703511 RepID=A0A6G1I9J0_9PEZI|nr:hypothetical protein EJ06DRAFT_526781 [Trichodelitschia bisporula]